MFVVHDLHGRFVGHLEGDRLRDTNGKPVGDRVSSDKEAVTLSTLAANRMAGRQVLLDLGIGDVVTPTTQFAVGIQKKPDFVADRVSPIRYVSHDRGTFFAESVVDSVKLTNPVGSSSGGTPTLIDAGFVSTSFVTTGYALATKVPRRLQANADFDLKKKTLRRIVHALRLAREVRMWALLTTSANWASGNVVTLGATAKWNAGTTANPLGDMMSGLKASYLPADVMIMPESTAQNFYVQPQASTGIRDYVQARGEMPEIMYARAKVFTAGSLGYVWAPATPSNVAIVRVPEDEDEVGTTITCRWLGQSQDGERFDGVLAREYYVPQDDSDYLVVAHNDAEVFLSNQVGALIVGATQ